MAANSCHKRSANLLQKLFNREIRASLQPHQRASSQKPFTKIPGRFCYRLRSLVPQSVLEEGHVFLGFTKCGQFVVSYSCQMDADEHTAFPVYVYKLQWWWFVPNRPLRKISETRLFGEEDLIQDLYIYFCEWPEDSTKVLVFGHSLPGGDQEGCQCYITVTYVPSLLLCSACSRLKSGSKPTSTVKCLRHSFCVHLKYELAPPFPVFSPRTQLKCDSILVVNTGDSIVAINIELYQQESTKLGFVKLGNQKTDSYNYIERETLSPLSPCSILTNRNVEICDTAELCDTKEFSHSKNNVEKVAKMYSQVPPADQKENSKVENNKRYCEKCSKTIPGSSSKNSNSPPQEQWFDQIEQVSLDDSHSCISPLKDVGWLCELHESGNELHKLTATSSKSRDDGKENDHSSDRHMSPHSPKGTNSKRQSLSQEELHRQGPVFCQTSQQCKDSRPSPLSPNLCTCNNGNFRAGSLWENAHSNNTRQSSQHSFFSPTNSTTETSKSSDSIILQINESRTVTYSLQRFSFGAEEDSESPGPVEDDFDLAYRSVLPVEVRGVDNTLMTLTGNVDKNRQDENLITVQLTFDIEHYMEEVIRQRADWGQRYVDFTNYDLQILDLCPDGNEVLGKVFALVHAKDENDKKTKRSRCHVKLYQTSITFEWNLKTGAYETLHIEKLTEVDENDIRKNEWKPGHRECQMLRRHAFIPQSAYRSVNVLSNESVFKGKSLSMILSPQHYIAVLL